MQTFFRTPAARTFFLLGITALRAGDRAVRSHRITALLLARPSQPHEAAPIRPRRRRDGIIRLFPRDEPAVVVTHMALQCDGGATEHNTR